MSQSISLNHVDTKAEKYEALLPQLQALVHGENDLTANLGNIMAALKYELGFFWVGVYLIKGDQLVLGPFQGPLACTRIAYGKGVCGKAWQQAQTIVVEDVEKFPGHIACSTLSKSEIVIPIMNGHNVVGVLDADSDKLSFFDDDDAHGLERICSLISGLIIK